MSTMPIKKQLQTDTESSKMEDRPNRDRLVGMSKQAGELNGGSSDPQDVSLPLCSAVTREITTVDRVSAVCHWK
jgi:hypothetical protein